jgi:hypothetical protein
MASTKFAVVPSPDQLAKFAAVDPALPARILEAGDRELNREFLYAVLSATYGIIALLSVVGGYIFLTLHGFAHSAAGLLAAGVLSLIGGFVRSRLRG